MSMAVIVHEFARNARNGWMISVNVLSMRLWLLEAWENLSQTIKGDSIIYQNILFCQLSRYSFVLFPLIVFALVFSFLLLPFFLSLSICDLEISKLTGAYDTSLWDISKFWYCMNLLLYSPWQLMWGCEDLSRIDIKVRRTMLHRRPAFSMVFLARSQSRTDSNTSLEEVFGLRQQISCPGNNLLAAYTHSSSLVGVSATFWSDTSTYVYDFTGSEDVFPEKKRPITWLCCK